MLADVFVRSGVNWSAQAQLKAANAAASMEFGSSVSVSGDTVVVGAQGEDGCVAGITNGASGYAAASCNENDDDGYDPTSWNSGAACEFLAWTTPCLEACAHSAERLSLAAVTDVFVRSGGTWSAEAHIKASDASTSDAFGCSLSLDGDALVVGAKQHASSPGAAYVFRRSGSAWAEEAILQAANAGNGDNFGMSVAIDGDAILVGAPYEDSCSAIVTNGASGYPADDSCTDSGAAYVFSRSAGIWEAQAMLKAANTHRDGADYFGFSVSLAGTLAVVGASLEDSCSTATIMGATGYPVSSYSDGSRDDAASVVCGDN